MSRPTELEALQLERGEVENGEGGRPFTERPWKSRRWSRRPARWHRRPPAPWPVDRESTSQQGRSKQEGEEREAWTYGVVNLVASGLAVVVEDVVLVESVDLL